MSDPNPQHQPSQDPSNPPHPDFDIDASIEADIDMTAPSNPNTNALNLDGANDTNDSSSTLAPELDPVGHAPDPRMPTKKDASLREFLGKMDEYAPIVRLTRPIPCTKAQTTQKKLADPCVATHRSPTP